MADKEHFKIEDIKDKILLTKGFMSHTAKALGMKSVTTLYNYIEKYPEIKETVKEAKESLLDYTESKLFDLIKNNNITAIIFFLKTQGKHRGYSDKLEIQSTNQNTNINIPLEKIDDPETLKLITELEYKLQGQFE